MTETPPDDSDGERSEVTSLDRDTPEAAISDGDHVAGAPSTESGDVEEGDEIGPEARTGRERPDDADALPNLSEEDVR